MKKLFETNIWCIQTGTTLKKAKEYMKEKRIRHLPIVDNENKVISIITQHDFTDIERFQELPADLFASFPVTYVTDETPLRNVALLMIEKKISCVLLTDSKTNVLGIITTDDLLYQLSEILKMKKDSYLPAWNSMDAVVSVGEFFKQLSNIGI
jgi:acetoin utilization protein AcuB